MASKRKAAKRASPAKTKPKKAPKKAAAKVKRKSAPRAASRSAGKPKDRAALMAKFSAKVLEEEEAPVAVRSFNEARQGIEQSKALNVKTGSVEPVTPDVDDEETADEASSAPKVAPLAGPVAIPKQAEAEEFRLAQPAKKGKKPAAPSKEELGKIELRMQRGSGDATIGRASPDYLQRSFNRAKETGRVTAPTPPTPARAKPDEFEVAADRPNPKDATLMDFGDVEIAQQTRSGRKKVGKLDAKDDED